MTTRHIPEPTYLVESTMLGGPLRSEVFSKLSRILDLMVSFDWE